MHSQEQKTRPDSSTPRLPIRKRRITRTTLAPRPLDSLSFINSQDGADDFFAYGWKIGGIFSMQNIFTDSLGTFSLTTVQFCSNFRQSTKLSKILELKKLQKKKFGLLIKVCSFLLQSRVVSPVLWLGLVKLSGTKIWE